ncbi:hypothetical protein R6Q59_030231 [Mikania micrantha]
MTSIIPKRFCGLRVLLVDTDKNSLQHHADVLKQNSYRVTTATEASKGLSMMIHGHTFDCVLIDADMHETDMEAFIHQVLKHQPHMSIILMASDDIHLRIPREALESEAVLCLLKPCGHKDICDIWKHICRNRISFKEMLHKENDHQALEFNSQENDAMLKKVTFEDLLSGDDDNGDDNEVSEITTKEDIVGTLMKKADKGKQPFVLKKKHDQPVEDDMYPKKRKEVKTRITWKGELDDKFKDALKELGEQAHSSAILKHMNVPGLTRFHVASHLQKYQKKQKSIEASITALAQRGNNLQVESFTNIKRPNSTQSVRQSSSLLRSSKHNLVGISYMVIENIRAKLQEAPPLHEPQLTTTTNGDDQATDHGFVVMENFNSGGQVTETQLIGHNNGNAIELQETGEISSHDHAFGDAMAPLGFGATIASDYDLGIDVNCILNDLDMGNFGHASGSGFDENLYQVSPHSATLFDLENCINPGSSKDSIFFGPASMEFSIPEFRTERKGSLAHMQLPVNSIFTLDGSEGRFIDNELSKSDLEHTKGLFNDDDGYLVHGQWYF